MFVYCKICIRQIMKRVIIFFFLFSFMKGNAQDSLTDKSADSVLSSAVNNLSESDFYFVGQEHANQANTIIEKALLFLLNKKFNVHYYILEWGQSLAFLLNQYLETGQDSILDFINPKGNFYFLRTIKSFNDTVTGSKKIFFFGLDYEDRLNWKWTKKAIEIISYKIKLPLNNSLQILLNAVINPQPNSEKENLTALKKYLDENERDCRLFLGKYYVDVLLIANAKFTLSQKRDKDMYANFKLIYKELERKGEKPKFFASFGIGHINPKNNSGLPYRLFNGNDSPIRNSVSVIGTQYYNCTFNVPKATPGPSGTLSVICKKTIVKSVESVNDTKERSITFFNKSELKNFGCDDAINKLSGLIIVRNFSGRTSWEF